MRNRTLVAFIHKQSLNQLSQSLILVTFDYSSPSKKKMRKNQINVKNVLTGRAKLRQNFHRPICEPIAILHEEFPNFWLNKEQINSEK